MVLRAGEHTWPAIGIPIGIPGNWKAGRAHFASHRNTYRNTNTDAGDAGDPWIDAGHSRLNADDLRLDADSRLDAGDPRLEAGTTGSTLTKRLGAFRNILQLLGALGNIWE